MLRNSENKADRIRFQQSYLSTKLLKNLKKVSDLLSLNLNFLTYFPTVPYRECVRIKNIRDAQGKVIKSMCPTDRALNHDWNRRNCESFNMNFLRISTPEEKTAILEFASDQYRMWPAAYIFFNGVLGNFKCNCVSNIPSAKIDVFSIYQCDCAAGLFSICEFKYPRGEKFKHCENVQVYICYFFKFPRFAT